MFLRTLLQHREIIERNNFSICQPLKTLNLKLAYQDFTIGTSNAREHVKYKQELLA